ncbi:MAG: hypothetical protein AB8B74_02135 [Crocinitomicaceae bacterium]
MKNEEIHSLIERLDFNKLSKVQQALVLSEMTESAYNEQRQTILDTKLLFASANSYEPKPLIIPVKSTHFLAKPIPLYQALVGIAAITLIMLLIFPIKRIELADQPIKYVTIYDTLETEVIKYDTVERVIEKPILREKLVYVDHSLSSKILPEEPRLLEVPRTNAINFSESRIKNKGVSMKDDTLSLSLPMVF